MTIDVYTKPACQPCRATKRKLDQLGVEYNEHQAADHMDMLAPLGHTSAPVVVVTNDAGDMVEHWAGFVPDKLKGLTREQ